MSELNALIDDYEATAQRIEDVPMKGGRSLSVARGSRVLAGSDASYRMLCLVGGTTAGVDEIRLDWSQPPNEAVAVSLRA